MEKSDVISIETTILQLGTIGEFSFLRSFLCQYSKFIEMTEVGIKTY